MTRLQAEQINSLHISWLKKYGYLAKNLTYKNGWVKWGDGSLVRLAMEKYNCDTPEEKVSIKLSYTYTDNEQKENMAYDIELATTDCNYGGKRYWFVCPLSKNGQSCGKRVGVLYAIGKWFGCRHCGDIAYMAQFEGSKLRVGSIYEPDVERAYREVKREYYRGRPTRKYARYLRLRERMDEGWIKGAQKLGINF